MTSSLVVQTSFIGDVVLSTPLIARLAQSGTVDVVTTPVGATVLANNPDIRHLLVYDKRGADRGVVGFVQTAIRARRSGAAGWSRAEGYARASRALRPSEKYGLRPPRSTLPATTDVMQDVVSLEPEAEVGGRGCGGVWNNISQLGRSAATHERGRWAKLPHTPDRCAYLAQGSIRSATLALAAGYTQRTGFDTSHGRMLYTHQVKYRKDWHHARRLLSLADEIYATTANDTALQPRLYPGAEDVAAVDRLLQERVRPFVAVAPGSVWETKRWPYYGQLSQMLGQDWDVAIVGGADDADSAIDILRRVPAERIINALGKLSLLGSAELIRRAMVLVGNDSAPQHLASAMGTPTVTVFGPTVPDFGFGPLALYSQVVGHDGLSCRPCDKHGPRRCPLGHWKCMREVPAVNVYNAVMEIVHRRVTAS